MITKKKLQERYGLADTTVYKTLQACGLPTNVRTYSKQQIANRFDVARKLLDGGSTYEDVAFYFSLRPAGCQ